MKKLFFLGILFLFVVHVYGQANPITNLNWTHWYIEHNYFRLTWSAPEKSEDTLIGYNIYRNNDLFQFQFDTILNHEELENGNCSTEFLDYNSVGGDFWIHVTAVYNSTKIESEYVDSAYVMGVAVSISEKKQKDFRLFPNPTDGKLVLDAQNVTKIVLINEQGRIVDIFKDKNQLDLSHLPKGMYLLKIFAEDDIIARKVILE